MWGFEEILGLIADWLGLDLRVMSPAKMILVVVVYSGLGLLFLLGGTYVIVTHRDDGVAILAGAAVAILGAAYLARITVNLADVIRQRRR
jgi:hypothetical protein